jgi:glycosyltransferase involved in cell wall biosynthesis
MKKKNKLKIAQIAPLWFPIPPKKYGGTEKIISLLSDGLVEKGHQVSLFASGDSKTKANLIAITKRNLINRNVPWSDWWWNNLNYSMAFEKAKDFDIIHSHWTPLGMYFQRFVKTPVLHTFHNLPKNSDIRWDILKRYKNSNIVYISQKEKNNSSINFRKEWVCYNGIDISKFKFNKKPKNHFIWIGRICKDKGIENVIKIAKKAKIKLLLAGQLQPSYKDYFNKEIKPHLNSQIQYIGELDQKQLSDFYGSAVAFLYPLEWQEPFGLCIVESQACGTPVIAFNRGSVPEVIKNGKTGFVVPFLNEKKKINIQGFVETVKKIDKIKREDCRKWVEENFRDKTMVNNYEEIYYKIINKKYEQKT